MSLFLAEIGKGLAARWLTLLIPSGMLFLGLTAAAMLLGHGHALDAAMLVRELDAAAARPATRSPGAVLLLAASVVLAAAGVALLVSGVAGAVETLWYGQWPRPLQPLGRRLTARRLARWQRADEAHAEALRAKIRRLDADGAVAADIPDTARLNAVRNRICLVRPDRPVWTADRIRAADLRVHAAYGLDLDSAWPRLWLIVPEETRAELRAARAAYAGAAGLAAWTVPYAVLALWWWPAAPVAAGIGLVALRRGRAGMDALAELVEAVVDLHCGELAARLTADTPDEFFPESGDRITRRLRKGA
ncbi:hypothetical protein ABZY68_22210 [Streptomyces sp. NPDC006482]|uniref:hypothetical protein n=1 Tax=Streptomyces sp. NPDC006482 TaxID=3154306 RepID=UPI0033B55E4F